MEKSVKTVVDKTSCDEDSARYTIKASTNTSVYIPYDIKTSNDDLKKGLDFLLEDTSTWNKVDTEKNFQSYKREVSGTSMVLVKSDYTLENTSAEDFYNIFWDLNNRKQWDEMAKDLKHVRSINESSDIISYYVSPPMMMVDDREFVVQRTVWRKFPEDNSMIFILKSVEDEACPPTKGKVSGKVVIQTFFAREEGSNLCVSFVGQMNMGGSLPNW
eukprot:CAMPEP_0170517524 /NCGR_PEP_ID=MMETSP0209-20121228/3487_1 /TAXON_ID=665100 ORGANISM="Litonotus pictus, Strain P1" /NCGR_SAMPLE_ID=MMETSP0209 /ASSEMBLY_ACC=CAM_ASM_000301 /LENGTH=215 /DNA_ID=CAMNT_0010802799 /DNA_START=1 /DNA_END=645 /DNA_ORIENTATION=+